RLSNAPGSLTAFALASDQPVVVADLPADRRFRAGSLFREQELKSGILAVMHGPGSDRPAYGVLGAFGRAPRAFSEDEAYFVQAVSAVIAATIARRQAESETAAARARTRDAEQQIRER